MLKFVGLDLGVDTVPDETSILRFDETFGFRHLLEEKDLSQRMLELVNEILTRSRDPEMHQTKKGNPWHFVRLGRIPRLARDRRLSRRPAAAAQPGGCKAHVGTDAASGLAHSVVVTPANVAGVTQAHALLHGQEQDVFADAGDPRVDKRDEVQDRHPKVNWHVAMRPGKRKQLDTSKPLDAVLDELESVKARIHAR